MGKMYYTEEEAIAKLGISKEALEEQVSQQKLRAYPDGARKMYKVEEVDALLGEQPKKEETGEIELTPVSSESPDAVSLSESDTQQPTKTDEDTVLTTEGASIFDDQDLEIETADPMAKTHVAARDEDKVLIEGMGSGSGLLDLTRESDDTSLGPSVLEHIDMESAVGSSIGGVEPETPSEPQEPMVSTSPVFVEAVDASAGLFTGVAAACTLMVLMLIVMTVAAIAGIIPSFVDKLKDNTIFLIAGGIVLTGLFGVAGMFIGKSISAKQEAMRRLNR